MYIVPSFILRPVQGKPPSMVNDVIYFNRWYVFRQQIKYLIYHIYVRARELPDM